MNKYITIYFLLFAVCGTLCAASNLFFGDPPDAHHPYAVHDRNRPQPAMVVPGAQYGDAPSDAIVLFDGTEASLANWEHRKPDSRRKRDWYVVDGILRPVKGAGYLATKHEFGDVQLHIEWLAPAERRGEGQGRGNSGVFLMETFEIQILDNYDNPTYPDGSAGALYAVMPPAVNALRPYDQWQSYDIIFRRPIVRDGVLVDEGSITVLCNGVVVQDCTPLEGGGAWKTRADPGALHPDKGSLALQDHGDSVSFRNIWIRPLRPRPIDGGSDGRLSVEATQAKRAEIAAEIRRDAAEMQEGLDQALRLYESLMYAVEPVALQTADAIIKDYLVYLESLDPNKFESEKKNLRDIAKAVIYLNKFSILPEEHFALPQVEALLKRFDLKVER